MNCHEFWSAVPEDGDLASGRHLLECPACAARYRRHGELEAGFRALAEGFRRVQAPPRVEARLLSAFRRETGREIRRPVRRWTNMAAWATAFAAMFTLAAILVRPRAPEAARPPAQHSIELALLQPQSDADGFIPLPEAASGAADEDDVNLVRVQVPRSAMMALGYEVSADRAAELVDADVMLGSDGIARAVRFLN